MDPLLSELGEAEAVTLVSGGLLGLLPLHAAWRPRLFSTTDRSGCQDPASRAARSKAATATSKSA
jgi:hypothetical protein